MAVDRSTLVLVIGALLLVALVFLTPLNFDEGQYVSAADLVASGLLPYRDFPYLQTPLQPIAFAPLAMIAPGWMLLASRLANAACVVAGVALIGKTAEAITDDRRARPIAMVAVLICDCVLFVGSIARNDALPFLLFAGSLERLFGSRDPIGPGRAFAAGLCVAAAASTKISYALPAAAIAIQAICSLILRSADRRTSAALLFGQAVGALPTLVLALLSPRPFLFQVVVYAVVAVRAWAKVRGDIWRFSPPVHLAEWAWRMFLGPLLLMLGAGIAMRVRGARTPVRASYPISLGAIVAAAILATIMPVPALRQYMLPAVAPVILWFFAIAWPKINGKTWKDCGRWGIAVLLLVFTTGVSRSIFEVARAPTSTLPIAVERDAHRIGVIVAHEGVGPIATLEPVHAVDSGVGVDPRFATGQFLFRAGDIPECRDRRLCPITDTTMSGLDGRAPGAILTGTQRIRPGSIPGGLDGVLDRWAVSHDYRPYLVDQKTMLWLAPRKGD